MTHVPLSILDLVPINEGSTAAEAIETSMRSAELADDLGFLRYWFAEHHNAGNLASSSTALLIGAAAARTKRIRVGAGGIMLPNHSPLVVAENFGTLENMTPGRIDLGLGRAPGTDPRTAQLLNRTAADPNSFANAIYQIQGWMSETGRAEGLPIEAAVAKGTNVPMTVLGSTTNGASIAAQLGLPFSVASHFAPDSLFDAIKTYREQFTTSNPTAQIEAPYVTVGVNVTVADTDEEAKYLFTTHQQMFLANRTAKRQLNRPPRPLSEFTDVTTADYLNAALRVQAVGSPATVVSKLESLQEQTGADEFIISYYIYSEDALRHSLELLAQAWF